MNSWTETVPVLTVSPSVIYADGYGGEHSEESAAELHHLDDEGRQRFDFVECPAFPPLLSLLLQGGVIVAVSAGVVYVAWRRNGKKGEPRSEDPSA